MNTQYRHELMDFFDWAMSRKSRIRIEREGLRAMYAPTNMRHPLLVLLIYAIHLPGRILIPRGGDVTERR